MQPTTPISAKTLRLGDALAVGGSLLVFIFSFAPFVTIHVPLTRNGDLDKWQNAWAAETFMAPLTWFVVFAGLLLIAGAALRYLGVRDPQPLGFRFAQLELGLGLFMLVVLFGMVTSGKHLIFGASLRELSGEGKATLSIGWGGILMLVGALTAVVGAVLTIRSVGPVIYPLPAAPAQPPAVPDQAYPPLPPQAVPPQAVPPQAVPPQAVPPQPDQS